MIKEFLSVAQHSGLNTNLSILDPMLKKWTPTDSGALKINTNVTFSEGKIGIGIFIRNHLGVPLFAKVVPRY